VVSRRRKVKVKVRFNMVDVCEYSHVCFCSTAQTSPPPPAPTQTQDQTQDQNQAQGNRQQPPPQKRSLSRMMRRQVGQGQPGLIGQQDNNQATAPPPPSPTPSPPAPSPASECRRCLYPTQKLIRNVVAQTATTVLHQHVNKLVRLAIYRFAKLKEEMGRTKTGHRKTRARLRLRRLAPVLHRRRPRLLHPLRTVSVVF
jgi:hypothetical protein